jgi:hypothetical protein
MGGEKKERGEEGKLREGGGKELIYLFLKKSGQVWRERAGEGKGETERGEVNG